MKQKKRILSLFLAVVMVLGTVPFTSVVANAEDTGVKKIEIGTSGVADKDFVYFGNYNNTDIKWKVLDADADNTGTAKGMFLLSEYLLEQNNIPFDADSNVWQGSDAQAWCTTFADSSAFTTSEKTALKGVAKTEAAGESYYGLGWGTNELIAANDTVFYLSAKEAANYIGANDGAEGLATTTSGNAAGGWWLRSPDTHLTSPAGFVLEDGNVSGSIVGSTYPGVRPAFNLNLNSVLFSSAAVGGKSSGTVGVAALNSVSEYTSDTARAWKVTLLDTNHENFTAQAADNTATSAATGYTNWSVDVTYNNALTGTSENVSAMLCDASGNVLYYGNIANNSANGTQAVTIPTGLAAGSYTLKVFSEQLNGDNKTDYASAFKDIALEVTLPKAETPSAGFTATSENGGTLNNVTTNMQYSIDGGANWIAVTDTTMDIADVTAANGVQVYAKGEAGITADSDAQTITVTQAVKPAGLTKTDCTTAANNDGKISGVNNTMEYRVSGSADAWTAVTGATITGLSNQSYDVRIKASGTVLASEAASFQLTAPAPVPSAKFAATSDNGGTLASVTTDMSYSVDGGTIWTVITDTTMDITGVTVANGVQVRTNGNGTTTVTSDTQTLSVTQAAQPTGLSKTDCSATADDGKISGVDDTMEYKVSGSNDWNAVTGSTITGLSNQTYLVRKAANSTVLASEAQSITIGYLAADYSDVDDAIDRANALTKTNYINFADVENAINAVVTGYDVTKQSEVNAFATAINDAIDALVYKDADYGKVDTALGKIPADLTLYTAKSVAALETAINAVEKDKDITEQATVDGYATAIEKAIKGLQTLADYSKVDAAISEIPADLSLYTDASVKALNDAKNAVIADKSATEQTTVDGYATAIENAIKALAYKDADYSKVDTALGKIPADLTLYTAKSVAALETAINAVEKDKDITEQATVDGYATAIEKAIKGLQTLADYSKVDAAISEIPADLSLYTDASVKALNDAKNAVIADKSATEQTTVDGYATAIENAIKALAYKDADYSKVDTALGKIPTDLSVYTDASVKVLNESKAAVVRDKNITEQATVNEYATAIQKAIDGLVKKTGTTGNTNDSNKDKNETSPQTGDSGNMALWIALLFISGGAVTVLGISKKRKKTKIG